MKRPGTRSGAGPSGGDRGKRRGPARGGFRREDPARPGLPARLAALDMIGNVLDKRGMLDESRIRDEDTIPPADRAQARSLADLTLRRLHQIDAILDKLVEKKPNPPINHLLRLLTAELAFAGSAPHAAVDLAVRVAKMRGAAKLSGLVNAIGRKLSDDAPRLVAEQDPTRFALPGVLRKRLVADWGEEATQAIMQAHLAIPGTDLTMRDPEFREALATDIGARIMPNGSLRLDRAPQLSTLPGFAEGAWWVQDTAASLPARLIAEPKGKRILDLCAAPGGKTLQLAAAKADVTALDISEKRLGRVRQNLSRMELKAEIVAADALEWDPAEPFDAILLDAPCSATGTIRRHPDLPHRFRETELRSLEELQAQLLDRAFGWLKPGGVLVYCTCSLLKSEGEDQIAAFLSRQASATLDPISDADLGGMPGDMAWAFSDGVLRTRPDMLTDLGSVDGFYAARLVKV